MSVFFKIKPFFAETEQNKKRYLQLKRSIKKHLIQRPGFAKGIDDLFVDKLSRLILDWCLFEQKLSDAKDPKEACKWAYCLGTIDVQLDQAFNVLELTPKQRRAIIAEISESGEDEITQRLRELIEVKKSEKS